MKGGDAADTLFVGAIFRDPKTKNDYQIIGIENNNYVVRNLTADEGIDKEKIKWTKDKFNNLKYIGYYDSTKSKFTRGGVTPDSDTPVSDTPVGGKSKRRRHKTRQTKRRKHRKSKSRRHRRR
jgi:hypothetical protein